MGSRVPEELEIRVGVVTVAFAIPGSFSLKDKRNVLRRILGRAKGSRQAFNASFAEVGRLDDPRRCVIAAAQVSKDADQLFRGFESIRGFLETFGDIVVEGVRTEVLPVACDGPMPRGDGFDKYGEGDR